MLPAPDYQKHPDYQFQDITLAEREAVLERINPYLAEARAAYEAPARPDYGSVAISGDHVRDFVRNGITSFHVNAIANVRALAQPHIDFWRARKMAIPAEQRTFEDCVLVKRADELPDLTAEIEELLSGPPADLLTELYQGAWGVELVLLHNNDESDTWVWSYRNPRLYENATLFHHVDTTVSRLKAMLYLTDSVTLDSGAFSYALGSHRLNNSIEHKIIRKAVRNSGLYLRDAETRRAFASLPARLQLKNDIGSELDPQSADARQLLAWSRSFPSSEGRLVVFDPDGIHSGGVVRTGRRDAIQIVFYPR